MALQLKKLIKLVSDYYLVDCASMQVRNQREQVQGILSRCSRSPHGELLFTVEQTKGNVLRLLDLILTLDGNPIFCGFTLKAFSLSYRPKYIKRDNAFYYLGSFRVVRSFQGY